MKVGILGTGSRRALGTGFVSQSHEVKIGSRDSRSDKAKATVTKIGPGTFADAALERPA